MIHLHDLDGCAPAPLAHYLKALGILRLVAEQADPQARGWWQGERFRLATTLDREALISFFTDRYRPTPVFNPWGARSGFYGGSPETSARAVLSMIEDGAEQRFSEYRDTIEIVRQTILDVTGGTKPESDQDKERLFTMLRQRVRDKSAWWLSAVSALVGDDIQHAALFGTGGSEASGSYTSAYMAAIEQALIRHDWDHATANAIFGGGDTRTGHWTQSMGQYMPDGFATPWDLLLAFEGAVLVRSAVITRSQSGGRRWMASPFFVAPTSYGYASATVQDEYAVNKGKQLPGRGEQWLPMWSAPLLASELGRIFTEGRATTRRIRAADGYSMARAVSGLGVQQGITQFIRYGYQQRNNLATHFAIPLGRFRVPEDYDPALGCLDDLDLWAARLRNAARSKNAPARLKQAERKLTESLFAVTQHADDGMRWQSVLLALAEVESVQVTGSGHAAGPIPALRPDWARAASQGNANTAELRLALAFALQRWRQDPRHGSKPIHPDTVRRHWLPLKGHRYDVNAEQRLQIGPTIVMHGRGGESDAIAVLGRRLIEASQQGERRLPLTAGPRASASPDDLSALLDGRVDLDRTLALARALMALDMRQWRDASVCIEQPQTGDWPDEAWMAIRLALLPWPLDERDIGADPAILRRLASGDAASAVTLALQRLRARGIGATFRVASTDADSARRWAAALAFPITRTTALHFLKRIDPPSSKS